MWQSGVEATHDMETFSDEAKALNITRHTYPDDGAAGDRLYREGCERAWQIVGRHVDHIRLIADHLERKGEILEGEAASLLPSP